MKVYLYGMKPKLKKTGIILLILIVVVIVITIISNLVIKNKIENALADLPDSIKVTYTDIEVSIWSGSVNLNSPKISVKGETTNKNIIQVDLKSLEVKDLGYWDYLMNDEISIDAIIVNEMVAKYQYNPKVEKESYNSNTVENLKKSINVKNIKINNSNILVSDFKTDSTLLSIPTWSFELSGFNINSKVKSKEMPFAYKSFNLNGKDLKWAMNEYENIFANSIEVTENNIHINTFELKTKYGKRELSSILEVERDHFDVEIMDLKLNAMDFGFKAEKQFYFNSDTMILNQPIAEIYRDKLVADDTTSKPLYGKMLRELNFDLSIKKVEINNGKLTYSEKVKAERQAGTLVFDDFNATLKNLGNTYGNENLTIDVTSNFMEHSPLKVDWSFNVEDESDRFVFKADLDLFEAEYINQFTKPNLNADMSGELLQTYFTIGGNPETSRIDLKVKYDNFKVNVLQDDGKEKNSFLSVLVNLFVSKDSDDEKNNFRYGQAEGVERDDTKSVFNFVWLSIKQGLLSAMTGDGEKEN